VHNRLEANFQGTSGAAIKAQQLSSHFSPSGLLQQAQASQPDFFKSKEINGIQDFPLKNEDSKDWGQLHIDTVA